jgi:glycosyltransferase involved in cell wall biosynthesis
MAVDAAEAVKAETHKSVRVLFTCSGIGIMNRGIESFFREAFDGLQGMDGIETMLIKGAGATTEHEYVTWSVRRTGRLARLLGKLARRNSNVVEQWSTFFPVVRQIRRFRPDVIFYSEANLGFLLYWFRKQIGVPYKLLFSNGGPCHPPFIRTDYVHQVAPLYYEEALRAGEPEDKHFFVPYGIHVPASPPATASDAKKTVRTKLGLPLDRSIVLSVGWVAKEHKRMDFVIEEISRLPTPRPFLQLLGAIDSGSAEIVELGNRLLGPENFSARSVPYEMVADYYRAANVFVLGSLSEGFGRVLLEAMMHGLPVVGHRHPVIEFVVGDAGRLEDLNLPGTLARAIGEILSNPDALELKEERWNSVRSRFDWQSLRSSYSDMFRRCAESDPRT